MNRLKILTASVLSFLVLTASAFTDSPQTSRDFQDDAFMGPPIGFPGPGFPRAPSGPGTVPAFKSATGTHSCWGKLAIGKTCQVSGGGFSDCNQARISLQMQDCCKNTYHEGKRDEEARSISFYLSSCW